MEKSYTRTTTREQRITKGIKYHPRHHMALTTEAIQGNVGNMVCSIKINDMQSTGNAAHTTRKMETRCTSVAVSI
eukprot:10419936-Ditylum_brightwellii.AAC.1